MSLKYYFLGLSKNIITAGIKLLFKGRLYNTLYYKVVINTRRRIFFITSKKPLCLNFYRNYLGSYSRREAF